MKKIKLIVNTVTEKYPIIIGRNIVQNISKIISDNSITFNKCLIVVDKNVPKNILTQIKKSLVSKRTYIYLVTANEKNKSQNTSNSILRILLTQNFTRQDCLISLGGGITGDIGSFTASLFKRGLKFINIPTTLLSQVDSSIGGKTGVNTNFGKNLIGTFYQPKLVVTDINFLQSLPIREIICGYGEILKHSLINNKNFFNFLNKNFHNITSLKSPFIEKAIYESCKIKKKIVEKDEKEKNLRKVLNFGHTFAHAYEATLGYTKKLNHGEAVILGIQSALKFAFTNKIIKSKEYELIINHFKQSNLPMNLKDYFSSKDYNRILSFMLNDKKNVSKKINLILLKKIGFPIIDKEFSQNILKVFLKKELSN